MSGSLGDVRIEEQHSGQSAESDGRTPDAAQAAHAREAEPASGGVSGGGPVGEAASDGGAPDGGASDGGVPGADGSGGESGSDVFDGEASGEDGVSVLGRPGFGFEAPPVADASGGPGVPTAPGAGAEPAVPGADVTGEPGSGAPERAGRTDAEHAAARREAGADGARASDGARVAGGAPAWDDGLIARRARPGAEEARSRPVVEPGGREHTSAIVGRIDEPVQLPLTEGRIGPCAPQRPTASGTGTAQLPSAVRGRVRSLTTAASPYTPPTALLPHAAPADPPGAPATAPTHLERLAELERSHLDRAHTSRSAGPDRPLQPPQQDRRAAAEVPAVEQPGVEGAGAEETRVANPAAPGATSGCPVSEETTAVTNARTAAEATTAAPVPDLAPPPGRPARPGQPVPSETSAYTGGPARPEALPGAEASTDGGLRVPPRPTEPPVRAPLSAAPPVREPLPTRPTPAPESPASQEALPETPASEAFLPGPPDSQAFLAGRPIREEIRDSYGRQAPHPSTAPYTPEHTPEFAPEGPSAPECAEDEEQRLTAPLAQSISVPELPAEAPVRAGRRSGPTAPGGERGLGRRLLALRELVGLSRTRLEPESLAEAVRVLDEASARGRLSRAHTTVAVAGPTGCGKSTLFNALAGAQLSEAGVRRPTTATPVACVWETSERTGGADGLLERLGVPPRARRRAHLREGTHRELGGLVLLDLPDHDSLAEGHRQQVDRLLQLVDAVIWVVDPEKYADAVLHERYLRPLAGHAEVTYVVLNQVDRLPEEAAGELLDDLRRLLDEDGMALGEHGDPGAQVLALSALSGQGVCELREALGELVSHQLAAARRLAADVDRVVDELRPVCTGAGNARPEGLTAEVRESFEERLAVAVGAAAAGRTAERVWLRQADLACGTSWAGLARWQVRRAGARRGEKPDGWAMGEQPAKDRAKAGRQGRAAALATVAPAEAGNADGPDGGIARPGGGSADGAARPGTQASEHLRGATDRGPALHEGAGGASGDRELREPGGDRQSTAWEQHTGRPVVEQAVRGLMDDTTRGLPSAWARAVRHAARTGGEGLPGALDRAVAGARLPVRPVRPVRPRWWTAAAVGQALLLAFQLIGVCWLLGGLVAGGMGAERWLPFGLLVAGALGGPALAWGCRVAARGPARAFGLEQESRLRRLAADCGRGRVLEPVAAELLRYTEAREQYVLAAGGPESVGPMR